MGYDGLWIINVYGEKSKAEQECSKRTEIQREQDLKSGYTLLEKYQPFYVEERDVL
jgi:hypothetical protein